MITILISILVGVALFVGLSWALTYMPGSKEDRDWLNYVWARTDRDLVKWKIKDGGWFGYKTFVGKDERAEVLYVLTSCGFSSKFLYSYSLKDVEDDGYTHNKTHLAYVSISPWRPMHKLYKAALAQIKTGKFLASEEENEPVGIVTPGPCYTKEKEPLFGLGWGEEPEWVKRKEHV